MGVGLKSKRKLSLRFRKQDSFIKLEKVNVEVFSSCLKPNFKVSK